MQVVSCKRVHESIVHSWKLKIALADFWIHLQNAVPVIVVERAQLPPTKMDGTKEKKRRSLAWRARI